jgi:hypothetical protein
MGRATWVWWGLPAAVTAAVAGTMHHVAEAAERGSRAGAEPVVAASTVAGLVVVQVLVVFVGSARQGYLSVEGTAQVACLVAALLVPLLPVWLVHAKERPEPIETW